MQEKPIPAVQSIAQPARRRWFRFSLRSLLVLVVVLAVPLGWIAKEKRQSQHEMEVAAQLEKLGDKYVGTGGPYDSFELREEAQEQGWRHELERQVLGDRIFEILASESDISDLTPLARLTTLRKLDLDVTSVSDLSPLAGLTQLELLSLWATSVHDISALARLTNLRGLNLENTHISDIKPLAGHTKLEDLVIEGTQVSDLTPLAGLKRLRFLDVSYTPVSDPSPLADLDNLESLNLASTSISSIKPLVKLTKLKVLNLEGTQIDDLKPLSNLTRLVELKLPRMPAAKEQIEFLRIALPNCKVTIYP